MAQKQTFAAKATRRKKRQRWGAATLIAVLLLGLMSWLGYQRLQAPLSPIQPTSLYSPITGQPTTNLMWPTYGQAAVGAAGYGVLASHGAQLPTPTASIAKLITALSVLQLKPLHVGEQGPMLTLNQADLDLYGSYVRQDGSVTAVVDGEQLSEYQALQAMLLPSSNNMADSTAVWAFGSLTAYADYANKQLQVWGLTQTHVGSDASGFSPSTTSTASDLVKLGELAVANPVLAEITAQSSADIPVVGTVHNVNWLLGTAGINGLKTGNSDQAGGTFLFSAAYHVPAGPKIMIVGVVLSASDLATAMNSAIPLLLTSQQAFGYREALAAGQAVGLYHAKWASPVTAVTLRSIRSLQWQGRVLARPQIVLSSLTAPGAKGQTVGSISYGSSDTTPVVLSQPVPAPSFWWRLPHSGR